MLHVSLLNVVRRHGTFAKPLSIEIAARIAQALEVSLDYLVGLTSQQLKDRRMLQRLDDLRQLDEEKQRTLFDLMDTYIRDFKTRQAFAS